MTAFHTDRLTESEHHDYHLRVLLCKYCKLLSGANVMKYNQIMTDNVVFSKTVNKYKHAVTHYLASKMEIWMAHFTAPVFMVSPTATLHTNLPSQGK